LEPVEYVVQPCLMGREARQAVHDEAGSILQTMKQTTKLNVLSTNTYLDASVEPVDNDDELQQTRCCQ
jgi:hypothetical protein